MITYFDTSVLVKLVVDDETGIETAHELWMTTDAAVSAELAYVEGRAALASARRSRRLNPVDHRSAREEFDGLWRQLEVVAITWALIVEAADLAESDGLRGYDAVHLAAALLVRADVIASADEQLCAAAVANGLAVADPASME